MARHGDGLYLRGKHTWYLNCGINGKRYQIKLGKHISRSVAKELALIKRAQILKGDAGIGNKRKDCSFEKAAREFLQWAQANKRPRTIQSYRQCIDHLGRSFKGKHLSQIHPLAIERHKRSRVEAGARVRPNRELAVLKAVYNRCREWGLFEGDNPVLSVKFLKEPRQRLRYLEPEEERRLLAVAGEHLHSLILLGINTGLRIQAEALTLRWEDVNFKRGLLSVQAAYSKSGQSRVVPLNSKAKLALERLKANARSEWVIATSKGTPYKSVQKMFARARQQAGLRDVTCHTLRHTFASRLVMAGADLRTVQSVGGWKSLSLVERYFHLNENHVAEALERIVGENSTTLFTTPQNDPLIKCV